ncbi:MAG: flippase [Clostridia bacterium]|nr:flippase [Clostridia bacterium]
MNNKVAKNAIWIIAGHVAQMLIGFAISMISARYLGPSNFGLINYASSLVAFVVPIMYLGINNILVREFVVNPDEEGKILGTSMVLNFLSAILCIVGITSFTSIVNRGEQEAILVCFLYSLLLIFQSISIINYWFQAKLLSKYTSLITLIAYLAMSGYKIYLLATGKSVFWFAVSQSFDYVVATVGSLLVYKKLGGQKLCFSFETAKRLFNGGRYYIISGMMITVFAQTDKIMIKLMIDEAHVGYYAAAVTCATLTSFFFSAIIDSMRPVILEAKSKSQADFGRHMSQLYTIIIYISLLQSAFMTLFAPYIINIIYGAAYAPAAQALRIVVWYTTFSYLGCARDIWILAEQRQEELWKIYMSGALANVFLNFLLIPKMGINGAALASLITQFFTNVGMGYIIPTLRPNNPLLMKGFSGKELVPVIQFFRKKVQLKINSTKKGE